MNKIKTIFSATSFVIFAFWSVAAPWLSANQFISESDERVGYVFGFFGLILSAALFAVAVQPVLKSRVQTLAACALIIAVCVGYLQAWIKSDRMFVFWKMKAIPPSHWEKMTSDLHKVAAELRAKEIMDITRQQMPDSLEKLKKRNEAHPAPASVININDGEWGVITRWGIRWRRWGLLVGSERFLKWSSDRYRGIPVATNAVFYLDLRD